MTDAHAAIRQALAACDALPGDSRHVAGIAERVSLHHAIASARRSLWDACNPDAIRALLDERDRLAKDVGRLARADLVATIEAVLKRMESNGMGDWKEAKMLRKALSGGKE